MLRNFSSSNVTRAQAQQLQKELDNLALLLDEVKKQTEKVEAAADAIGDALLGHLDTDPATIQGRQGRKKAGSLPAAKANLRSRQTPALVQAQSTGLQQA